jgi:hypothetical protein
MNDDYLWDGTGEPDPEIQRLEEMLVELRYKDRRLEIPAQTAPRRRHPQFHLQAIAAAAAFLALALGIWLGSRVFNRARQGGQEAVVAPRDSGIKEGAKPVGATPEVTPDGVSTKEQGGRSGGGATLPHGIRQLKRPTSHVVRQPKGGGNVRPTDPGPRIPPGVNRGEAEAKAAKDQIMTALYVASAKLNFAQRRARGADAPNILIDQKYFR